MAFHCWIETLKRTAKWMAKPNYSYYNIYSFSSTVQLTNWPTDHQPSSWMTDRFAFMQWHSLTRYKESQQLLFYSHHGENGHCQSFSYLDNQWDSQSLDLCSLSQLVNPSEWLSIYIVVFGAVCLTDWHLLNTSNLPMQWLKQQIYVQSAMVLKQFTQ
jgi:hypothetical protein